MTRNLRYLFLLLFIALGNTALAQFGSISGTVVDEKKEPIIGAIVEVRQGGVVRGGAQTDIDGKYVIKPLAAATDYEVTARYTGYKVITQNHVQVTAERNTELNFNMAINTKEIQEVIITEYKVPLIKKDEPGTSTTFTGDQILKMPTRNTADVASLSGGTYQQKNGAALSIGGARTSGTLYIIDGVQVNGSAATNLPPGAIDQLSVISSGIPARYGDASGGIVNITTRGPSPTTRGNVAFEHSIDGYNHNLAYFSVSGPLWKKKIDSVNKRPVLGYALSGQYIYNEDDDPNYYDNYVVKSDKLNEIRQNPLVAKASANGTPTLRYASEYITMNDLETRKKRINADKKNANLTGKLDYQVSDNANITVGGVFDYNNASGYNRAATLFAPESIPVTKQYTGRGYIRFTQRFGRSGSSIMTEEDKEAKKSIISNAFYTVQADYQTTYTGTEDPNHKKNAFDYGYIGKFYSNTTPFYAQGVDDSTGLVGVRLLGYNLAQSVDFERSEKNPYLANYTSQVYDILGASPSSLFAIQQNRGLLNGDEPAATYGLWSNVGSYLNGYSYSNQEQFSFNIDASFDLQPKKTRHAIEFGLYYQQRSERAFGITASGSSNNLWATMRLLANKHLASLSGEPIFVKNGVHYTRDDWEHGLVNPGPNDTILYNIRFDTSAQATFDKNLRKKLGLDVYGTDNIDVDRLDPSTFSLSMFSADELLNNGVPLVSYYGYDYTGKRVNGQVNFNDWFTKKNAEGDYTREIGAFRPNYIAGYIQDRFELPGGSLFSLGVRVERFDANTKALKDPYSLYATYTVANSNAVNNFNGGVTPDNIKSDYVVYVADNTTENPQVIGYRNGDDWYDPYGRLIQDPTTLKQYSGGRDPQPYLQRNNTEKTRALTMKDEGYDPNSSFTDYKPQVNVMPRISFTFPIADQSMFYAHYDILVQRPKSSGEIYATPDQYYFINQNSGTILPNPDLKPEKLYDYELGFQQALTRYSAVTLNAFYKERKDMIQARPYLYAWPITYWTFGNRDFSTTKGITLKYDLRRVQHLEMLVSYTLQFAEGTASNNNASGLTQNFISAQLPNLRFSYPLNVDSRHLINVSLDYRYSDGEGPIVSGSHILQNAGLNLIFRARSGEPYTAYQNAISSVIEGGGQGLQGSRLPWHYMMDLRIDKQFALNFRKKALDGIKRKSDLGLTAFIYVQNLLNTRDVLSVYGFTGRADDNGYLASPQGQLTTQSSVNPQSYYDLYSLSLQNPGMLNNPRRINLGLSLNF